MNEMRIPNLENQWPGIQIVPETISPDTRALAAIGTNLTNLANVGLDLFLKKQEIADTEDAMKLWLVAEEKMADLEVKLKQNPDYRTHYETWKSELDQIQNDILSESPNTRVSKFLTDKFNSERLKGTEKKKLEANQLAYDQGRAEADNEIKKLGELGFVADTSEQYAKVTSLQQAVVNRAESQRLLTHQEAQIKRQQIADNNTEQLIRKDMERDPLTTAARLRVGVYEIDPKKAMDYYDTSMSLFQTRETERIRNEEKQEKHIKEQFQIQSERKRQLYEAQIFSGKSMMPEILQEANNGTMDSKDTSFLFALQTRWDRGELKALKESDQMVLAQVGEDVYSMQGILTTSDITSMVGKKITWDDAKPLLNHLVQKQNHLEAEGKSAAMVAHNQAEELIKEALKTKGVNEQIDRVAQALKVDALIELSEDSKAIVFKGKRGTQDPLGYAIKSIIPKYQAILIEQKRVTKEAAMLLLKYHDPISLETAWKEGKLSPYEYELQKKIMLKLDWPVVTP